MRVGANETLVELDKVRAKLATSQDPLEESCHLLRKRYCELIESVLFSDLEYSIGRKLEQDLWNVAFRMGITNLQKSKQNGKLSLMIELSTAYYLQLLQRLAARYRVTELKGIPSSECLGILDSHDEPQDEEVRITKRSRILYICQYCLIHLGDLARYKNDIVLAQRYYLQSMSVEPRNGHPYNQLGLLEAAKANRLATVFFYIRSLSVSHPFVVSMTNLDKLYQKTIQERTGSPVKERLGSNEFISAFIYFIALVHLNSQVSQEIAPILTKMLPSMASLIASGKLDQRQLLMVSTISLFTYHRTKKSEGLSVTAESIMEKEKPSELMSQFVFALFRALLLPHTSSSLDKKHVSLPSILVLLESLLSNPKNVAENTLPDLWFVLSRALNTINTSASVNWLNEALPEDFDLRGFLPLRMVHSKVNFNDERSLENPHDYRLSRLVKQAKELTKIKFTDGSLILTFEDDKFEAPSGKDFTDEQLCKELEKLRVDPSAERVRFSIDETQDRSQRKDSKPKRHNVALEAIMQHNRAQEGVQNPQMTHRGHMGMHGMPLVPPGKQWMPSAPVLPNPHQPMFPNMAMGLPPPPPPPPAPQPIECSPLIKHPSQNYPMTIEELVKQPPPPIYNVDLRMMPPVPGGSGPPVPGPPNHGMPSHQMMPNYPPQPHQQGLSHMGPMVGPHHSSHNINPPNTYSLFAGGSWTPTMRDTHLMPANNLNQANNFNGLSAVRPTGGSLWKPDKSSSTSALERLLKETKQQKGGLVSVPSDPVTSGKES